MIKANAYGHGLNQIARYAWKDLGVKNFGVASLGEAVELRKSLPSMRARIMVFSDTGLRWPETRSLYLDYNIEPVVSSFEDLEFFLEDEEFSHVPLNLKVDTGMHRLGFETQDAEKICKALKRRRRFKINHLMTHFSSSFIRLKNGDRTFRQYDAFLAFKKDLRSQGVEIEESSCANSGALEQGISLEESHIRPGLMLYGPASVADKDGKTLWRGKNISSLKTNVIKVFPVKKGTPIGYGAHVCHQDGVIVYAPVGYGDGILTSYSKASFMVEGFETRVLGRVNMDLTALWFGEEAAGKFKAGQSLRLWDHDADSVRKLAHSAKTIPYQIFTAVSSRIPRSYIP